MVVVKDLNVLHGAEDEVVEQKLSLIIYYCGVD